MPHIFHLQAPLGPVLYRGEKVVGFESQSIVFISGISMVYTSPSDISSPVLRSVLRNSGETRGAPYGKRRPGCVLTGIASSKATCA